ncbi:MAG: MATE family efflux transporter [Oscillospiraceae bacterium]|nr:MATE family efflux transporter [Oscillospiraceae bacterium]
MADSQRPSNTEGSENNSVARGGGGSGGGGRSGGGGVRRGSVDFREGTPWKKILKFSVPILLGNFFQQLYNMTDTIIVGRGVGHIGMAAVGLSGPLLRLLIAIFMGVSQGATILVGQYFGARDEKAVRQTLHTAIFLALIVGGGLSVVGYIYSPFVLRLLNTPDDLFVLALAYMRISYCGVVFQMLYNMSAGFMRGIGNSRTPVYTLVLSSAINAILTYIFVFHMDLSVAGSALGTIIAQAVSCVVLLSRLHKENPMTRISFKELRITPPVAKEIVTLGFPSAIQQGAMSIGGVVIQGFLNSYGTVNIAGYVAAMRVDSFAGMPIQAFNMAMTSYTAQNVGAGRMDRVESGVKQGFLLSVSLTAVMATLLLIYGRYPLMLFTDNEPTILAALTMMRIVVPFYLLNAINQPMGGVMRGAGETVIPMTNALMQTLGIRIPLIYVLNYFLKDVKAVYWSQVGGQLYGFIALQIIYRKGNWKKKAFARIESLYGSADGPRNGEAAEDSDEIELSIE